MFRRKEDSSRRDARTLERYRSNPDDLQRRARKVSMSRGFQERYKAAGKEAIPIDEMKRLFEAEGDIMQPERLPGEIPLGDDVGHYAAFLVAARYGDGYEVQASIEMALEDAFHEAEHVAAFRKKGVPAGYTAVRFRQRSGRLNIQPLADPRYPADMSEKQRREILGGVIDAATEPSEGDELLQRKNRKRLAELDGVTE